MQVLHGTWDPLSPSFTIWAENAEVWMLDPERPMHHPQCVSRTLLERILTYCVGETASTSRSDMPIWLPSTGGLPCPSPEAQKYGVRLSDAAPALQCWLLPHGLSLSSAQTLRLLLALSSDLPGNVVLGSDLVFWRHVALLVINCLVEQRYMPVIEQRDGIYHGKWEHRADTVLLSQMASHMPDLCRAMVAEQQQAPAALYLINSLIDALLDAFVRDSMTTPDPAGYRHRWLRALSQVDSRLTGAEPENRHFYENWLRWRQAASVGTESLSRICFRLEEPTVGRDTWYLRFLLQAVDDPGLLVEADTIWATSGEALVHLERRFDSPHETLLAALGAAARAFPPIERSLLEPNPAGLDLNPEEARQFLTETSAILEQNQLGVMVPNWWRRAARLKARVKVGEAKASSSGFLSRDSLVNYRWELSLGDQTISREEFEELVALRQPLMQWRGQWVSLSQQQIQSALRFFEKQKDQGDLLDALKMAAGPDENIVDGIQMDEVEVTGWLNDLVSRLRDPALIEVPAVPEELHAELRPYQVRGLGWLSQMRHMGLGACLADDMGLGKTIQAIALWLYERQVMGVPGPILVVCPTSVIGNWRHEVNRFAPSLRVLAHHGPDRLQGKEFAQALEGHDVVLTSYALLTRDRDTLAAVHWSGVALDEAQNIKNPSTKQAQAARALQADHRLALTGTPVENRLSELWSIFQFLNPGYLGSREAFRSQFSMPIERYGDEAASARLRRLVAPFILRRVKSDPAVIQDLPDKFESKIYCTLTPEQATLYEAAVRAEMEALDTSEGGMQRRGGILRMLTRLKQICNHPSHFLKEQADPRTMGQRSGKLARLQEMLEEVLDQGERALIFTQYAEMGTLLEGYLQERFGRDVLFLHGGTPSKSREQMIARFQSEHGPAIFVLSLKAGGTGLNLTRASAVFHYDRWYNPAVENQATDRAYRIGQTKDVQVNKLICLGTLEEQMDEMLERKQALADSIVDAGESYFSEMSNEELRQLVALRREAVWED